MPSMGMVTTASAPAEGLRASGRCPHCRGGGRWGGCSPPPGRGRRRGRGGPPGRAAPALQALQRLVQRPVLADGEPLAVAPEAGREILSRPPGQTAWASRTPTASQLRRMAARLRGTWTSSIRTVRSGWRRSRTARRRWKRLGVLIARAADTIPRGVPREARPNPKHPTEGSPLWPSWNVRGSSTRQDRRIPRRRGGRASSPSPARASPRSRSWSPGPTTSTRPGRSPTASRRCWSTSSASTARAGWRTPATSRSCRSTRASSTRPPPRSRPTRPTSIPRTSSVWRSRPSCNAVASTMGVLGALSRKYAHRIPFIAKINHNELLTYPNKFQQILFGHVEQAWEMGAAAVGATVYFGSEDADRGDRRDRRGLPPAPTSWGSPPSSGPTPGTTPSRRTGWTTTRPPT